jgi:hypothetical protein
MSSASTAQLQLCNENTVLRDLLCGVELKRATRIFEAALNPVVKRVMQQHFLPTAEQAVKIAATDAAIKADKRKFRDELTARLEQAPVSQRPRQEIAKVNKQLAILDRLDQQLAKECGGGEQKELTVTKAEKKSLGEQLTGVVLRLFAPPPVRAWLAKCKEAVGKKMQDDVHEDNVWDTYSLCRVLHAFMRDAFKPELAKQRKLSVQRLQKLDKDVALVVESRNLHSYLQQPSEREAVESMRLMEDILRDFGCDAAADKVGAIVKRSRGRVERARQQMKVCVAAAVTVSQAGRVGGGEAAGAGAAAAAAAEATVATEALHLQRADLLDFVLYRAMLEFEPRFRDATGGFKAANVLQVPGARAWDDERRQVLIRLYDDLARVGALRQRLFHNAGADRGHDEACAMAKQALASMGRILHRTVGIKDALPTTEGDGPPADWEWCRELERVLRSPMTSGGGLASSDTMVVAMRLVITGSRMSIPVTRDGIVIGRDDDIAAVIAGLLAGGGSRVVVWGEPGVGKDVVARVAVRDKQVSDHPGFKLQAWLLGSNDDTFRRQLIRLFESHEPEVVKGCADDDDAALLRIKQWLAANDGWFFVVEDASWLCQSLCEVLPPGRGSDCDGDGGGGGACRGAVLFTSQEDFDGSVPAVAEYRRSLGVTECRRLEQLSPLECVEVWREMQLFSRHFKAAIARAGSVAALEAELLARCNEPCRCRPPRLACVCHASVPRHATRAMPTAADAGEDEKQRKKRVGELFAAIELASPGVLDFFDRTLGCLPLSVQLTGHALRVGSESVKEFIAAADRRHSALQTDVDGQNRKVTGHWLGQVMSVQLLVDRIVAPAGGLARWQQRAAIGLLACMSMLHRTLTPQWLFRLKPELAAAVQRRVDALGAAADVIEDEDFCVFRAGSLAVAVTAGGDAENEEEKDVENGGGGDVQPSSSVFDTASDILCSFGLLRRQTAGSAGGRTGAASCVAAPHQMVQRCVRELLLRKAFDSDNAADGGSGSGSDGGGGAAAAAAAAAGSDADDLNDEKLPWSRGAVLLLRQALLASYRYDPSRFINAAGRNHLDELDPAVVQWCEQFASEAAGNQGAALFQRPAATLDEARLCRTAGIYSYDQGRLPPSLTFFKKSLATVRRVLPADHDDIAMSLNNLGTAYESQGDTSKAIELFEESGAMRRRVSPADHAHIATSLGNLGSA